MSVRITIEGVALRQWYYPSRVGLTAVSIHDGMFATPNEAFAFVRVLLTDIARMVPDVVGVDVLMRIYEGLRIGRPPRARGEQRGTLLLHVAWRLAADERGLRFTRIQEVPRAQPGTVPKIHPTRRKGVASAPTGYNPETGEVDV